jgi:hypothetical protein
MELFQNADAALKFALRYSSQQYAQTPMAKRLKSNGSIGSGKGLVGLDGAAQAGMVRARLERMGKEQQACLVARFSARVEDCPCCGGNRMLDEYKESLLALAAWADQFVSNSGSAQRLRFGVVQAYFDKKATINKLAEAGETGEVGTGLRGRCAGRPVRRNRHINAALKCKKELQLMALRITIVVLPITTTRAPCRHCSTSWMSTQG